MSYSHTYRAHDPECLCPLCLRAAPDDRLPESQVPASLARRVGEFPWPDSVPAPFVPVLVFFRRSRSV